MRLAKSFLLSLNAHVWTLLLLSLAAAFQPSAAEPQPIEVCLLRMPAPEEGTAGGSASASPAAATGQPAASASSLDSNKAAAEPLPAPDQTDVPPDVRSRHVAFPEASKRGPRVSRTKQQRLGRPEPRVEYRFRVAVRGAVPRKAAASTSAGRPATLVSGGLVVESHHSGRSSPAPGGAGWPTTSGGPAAGRAPGSVHLDTPVFEAERGGDPRPLVQIIQARIDAVTPLVQATAPGCRREAGVVRLVFWMNRRGYPEQYRIVRSSGSDCLDGEVDNVLHLAEPYPFVAGWVPVSINYRPAAIMTR